MKKLMRNLLQMTAAIALVIVVGVSMAACGSGSGEKKENTYTVSSEVPELTDEMKPLGFYGCSNSVVYIDENGNAEDVDIYIDRKKTPRREYDDNGKVTASYYPVYINGSKAYSLTAKYDYYGKKSWYFDTNYDESQGYCHYYRYIGDRFYGSQNDFSNSFTTYDFNGKMYSKYTKITNLKDYISERVEYMDTKNYTNHLTAEQVDFETAPVVNYLRVTTEDLWLDFWNN